MGPSVPGLNRRRSSSSSGGPGLGGSFTLQVRGAEQLGDVARELRRVADKDLRKQMNRGLRQAAKPLIADTRKYAREHLPKHGGLNERVARSKFRTKIRTGANPSIRITATGLDARLNSQGRVRHPVYGNRRTWVQQRVAPFWFDTPMRRGAPHVRRALTAVLDDVTKQLEGR